MLGLRGSLPGLIGGALSGVDDDGGSGLCPSGDGRVSVYSCGDEGSFCQEHELERDVARTAKAGAACGTGQEVSEMVLV